MENSYTLEFEDRGTYLYAHLTGTDSFASSLSYWNEIADKIKDLGIKKLLIHENLTGETSETEIYDLVADLKNSGLLNIRVALFDENPADAELNAFGKLTANNLGGNLDIFQTLEAAQHWIGQDD